MWQSPASSSRSPRWHLPFISSPASGAPPQGRERFHTPPLYTQVFNLYAGGEFREFDDYDQGMAFAAENGRPVLIDFSGYGCVNCRKMEGAVFDTEEISGIIRDNFVLIKLMVDDKTKLDTPYTVEDAGKTIKITTVGEKWSYLQRHKFAANSQPYYVMIGNDGNPSQCPTTTTRMWQNLPIGSPQA